MVWELVERGMDWFVQESVLLEALPVVFHKFVVGGQVRTVQLLEVRYNGGAGRQHTGR